jgi:heme ABC exporter ATP-binding subunit CcmA
VTDAPVVALDAIAVRAGASTILRGVDLVVAPGEAVGVFGSNGAGKTTLLRVIATLWPPSSGTGKVFGTDIAGAARFDIRHRIGMIGHVPALYPELTLRENLRFVARVRGHDETAVDRALAAVGLANAADRKVVECSHGMQRRSEFAREMMLEPELLLLDEPHAALDPSAVELVNHLAATVMARGGAVLIVSHDLDRAGDVVHRTERIEGGRFA